ncbi:DUF4276 family protein [Paraburkholderia bannensis]|uniref:DUF4276 family protein n=1 Tax=Paraburkholderia bannensis TaxID=765414 RepID=UPI002AB6E83D|nr:DUF4276 family protein [Paraburkholderia bannensis]
MAGRLFARRAVGNECARREARVMVHLVILGEGQTEEVFVRDVLAPELGARGIFVRAQVVKTSKSGRGGALNLERVRTNLRDILRQRDDTYVSTMFDLYALGPTFPGFAHTRNLAAEQRAAHIEHQLCDDIVTRAGCRRERFIAHVQPHEFEALLFTDVQQICTAHPDWSRYEHDLARVRNEHATPEHINDSPTTAPSKRLMNLLKPSYKKTMHGPVIAKRIGLTAIRAACPHFGQWFDKLTALQPL